MFEVVHELFKVLQAGFYEDFDDNLSQLVDVPLHLTLEICELLLLHVWDRRVQTYHVWKHAHVLLESVKVVTLS